MSHASKLKPREYLSSVRKSHIPLLSVLSVALPLCLHLLLLMQPHHPTFKDSFLSQGLQFIHCFMDQHRTLPCKRPNFDTYMQLAKHFCRCIYCMVFSMYIVLFFCDDVSYSYGLCSLIRKRWKNMNKNHN